MSAPPQPPVLRQPGTHRGSLPSSSRYVVEVPGRWNGVLVLASHPVPVGPDDPPWPPDDPLVRHLVANGYGVAGSANTIFWPLELVFGDVPALLDVASRVLGPPRHTVFLGLSIGGIIAAGAVQLFPDRLSGALPIGGNLAGAIANHNRELDIAFVVKTLLAADTELQVVRIGNSGTNLDRATSVLERSQTTPSGRARLALAAAVGNIPGWHSPTSEEPPADDFEGCQRNQFAWFDEVGFLVFFLARKQVELQAGGNPSWNTGVDYADLLARSINTDQVEAMYRSARISLDDDLECLAREPRIDADPDAVAYLERHIVFDGDLRGIPVLAVHTSGDGLVTPDHEHAYADVVRHAGHEHDLRQLFVRRGGHCTLTFAEIRTALGLLLDRIESGRWPELDAHLLNEAARTMGPLDNVLPAGDRAEPAFFPFEPRPFPRPYDARDIVRRSEIA